MVPLSEEEEGKGSKKMKDKSTPFGGDFGKCIEFHGHACPGLAIGLQAARALMERLGVGKASDEELVAIVETDACGADAIQVMTRCTFGKGNFLFKDYGKHAFSLMDRRKRKGVRVCLQPDAIKIDPEFLSLSDKVRKDEASAKEQERYKQLQQGRIQKILSMDVESLFKIEEIAPEIPHKARILKSGVCDFCREPVAVTFLRERGDKRICIPCAERQGSGKF